MIERKCLFICYRVFDLVLIDLVISQLTIISQYHNSFYDNNCNISNEYINSSNIKSVVTSGSTNTWNYVDINKNTKKIMATLKINKKIK